MRPYPREGCVAIITSQEKDHDAESFSSVREIDAMKTESHTLSSNDGQCTD